jgi:hypothetical protein
MPAIADQGFCICSESSFCRLSLPYCKVQRRGSAIAPQEARALPRLRAARGNQVCSWDITNSPTIVRGVWLYPYLVSDGWCRKVVTWNVQERED